MGFNLKGDDMSDQANFESEVKRIGHTSVVEHLSEFGQFFIGFHMETEGAYYVLGVNFDKRKITPVAICRDEFTSHSMAALLNEVTCQSPRNEEEAEVFLNKAAQIIQEDMGRMEAESKAWLN